MSRIHKERYIVVMSARRISVLLILSLHPDLNCLQIQLHQAVQTIQLQMSFSKGRPTFKKKAILRKNGDRVYKSANLADMKSERIQKANVEELSQAEHDTRRNWW
jgi:hypothetical protein